MPIRAALQALDARTPAAIKGAFYMLCGSFFAMVMQTAVRYLGAVTELPSPMIVFFRMFLALVFLSPWLFAKGPSALRTSRFRDHALRAMFTVIGMSMIYAALAITPLAEVTALNFVAPIFATIVAMVVLGEKVRLRRWIAIIIGFAGTLVILRPGFQEIGLGQLLAVGAGFSWGCGLALTKSLSRTESPYTITLYMALLMSPMALIPALLSWQWPTPEQYVYLAIAAGGGTLAHICFSASLKEADTSIVMPVDFFKLIWAALFGYFIFAEVPDIFVWIGGTMIFASATYIAIRESRLKKQAAVGGPTGAEAASTAPQESPQDPAERPKAP